VSTGGTVAAGRRPILALSQVRTTLTSRVALEGACVVLGCLAAALVLTWPVVAHASSTIVGGGIGGDEAGYVWDYWYAAEHGVRLWGSGVQDIVGAPFGREYAGSINTTLLVSLAPAWVAAKLGNGLVAYNVVAISGLTLSGAAMYALVRWLRLGMGIAIWAAGVFMIFPYMQVKATAHPPLSHLECFPLVFMAGLWWLERPGPKRALVMTGALAYACLTNPYYALMAGIVVVVVLLAGGVRVVRARGAAAAARRLGEPLAMIGGLILLPLVLLFTSSETAVQETVARPRYDLEAYGARLTDYVRPPNAGIWHDLMGNFGWANVGGERMNFLGYSVIALALVGLVLGWRRRRTLRERQRLLLLLTVPLAFVLVWFSLASPSTWFGSRISMPSGLIFDHFPYLRVYARFVGPLMCLSLAVAAVGLYLLLRDRSITTRLSVLSVAGIVAVVELAPTIPLASAPPVEIGTAGPASVPTWQWLRTHAPGEIVYELPGVPNELLERYYLDGQILHGHPLLNGNLVAGQLATDFQREVGDVTVPGEAGRLASVGVRLVAMEPWGYRLFLKQEPLDPAKPPDGFLVVRTFGDGSAIWRVAAAPDDAVAVNRTGYWANEVIAGQVWRYMADSARTTIVARRPGTYRATLRARGFLPGVVYTLAIRGPDGSLRRVRVSSERTLTLTFRLTGTRGDVTITDEGPRARRISDIDGRIVSVQMGAWTLTRIGPP
jgi:hypothetical protein